MKNFIRGMSSIFNFMPSKKFVSLEMPKIFYLSDEEVIFRDWKVVGNDIRSSMTKFEEKYKLKGLLNDVNSCSKKA